VATAKQRLGGKDVHLLQYHTWDYLNGGYLSHLQHLDKMRESGEIRALGLCNFDTLHMRIVVESGIKIATNQVSTRSMTIRTQG